MTAIRDIQTVEFLDWGECNNCSLKNHFTVSFYAPTEDIGLKLSVNDSNELVVVGFNKPNEKSKQISQGKKAITFCKR